MSMMRNMHVNVHDEMRSGNAVSITPAMAQDLLDKQPKNRKVRKAMVDQLLRAFERGEAICHPSMAVMVDQFGRLVDGQHRLHAIVLFGRPVTLWMVTVDRPVLEAFHNYLPRSASDSLAINYGLTNCNNVAGVARMVDARLKNRLYAAGTGRETRMTPAEILAIYEQFNVDHAQLVTEARSIYDASLLPITPTQLGYLLFQHSGIGAWLMCLLTDEGNKTTSQLAVRRLLADKQKHKNGKVVLMTKAYNNPNLTKFYIDHNVPDLVGGKFEGLD